VRWLLSHPVLMVAYALATSAFFSVLWREQGRDRWKLLFQILIGLLGGGVAVALLMEYSAR
jgi:uncharacterized membrane protein YfcA